MLMKTHTTMYRHLQTCTCIVIYIEKMYQTFGCLLTHKWTKIWALDPRSLVEVMQEPLPICPLSLISLKEFCAPTTRNPGPPLVSQIFNDETSSSPGSNGLIINIRSYTPISTHVHMLVYMDVPYIYICACISKFRNMFIEIF